MFSSRSSIISDLIFKSLIQFELIFVYVCKTVVQLHSFVYGCSIFPTPFTEETVLFLLYILTWVYFRALYSVPLISVSVFMPVSYCVNYYGFVISFEIKEHDASSFVLSQDCFGYSGSFVVPCKFLDCSISVKNTIGILIETALCL